VQDIMEAGYNLGEVEDTVEAGISWEKWRI
jgi:hypothetical protein